MEKLVTELVNVARTERMAVSGAAGNQLEIWVYPRSDMFVLAIGYGPEVVYPGMAEAVLRRRSSNIARYGSWLPTLFSTGALYVVQRVENAQDAVEDLPLSDDELQVALELMI